MEARFEASLAQMLAGQQQPRKIQCDLSRLLGNACMRSDVDMIRSLLARGAAVNECDGEGKTPLLKACVQGNEEVAKTLNFIPRSQA